MLIRNISPLLLLTGFLAMGFVSCKKNEHIEKLVETPEAARFNAAVTSGSYFINNTPAGQTYKIPISISTKSGADRTLQLSYSSPTGAAQGTQYNGPATVTIPAGEVLAELGINGLMSGYATAGRRDTLFIKIASPDTIFGKGTFRVVMQKYCDVVLNNMLGAYTRTTELFGTSAWGPYTTTISSAVSTGATKARITVTNIYDFGWGPIQFDLDWTNPIAFTAEVVPQSSGIADAGTLSSTYAGQQVAVRPFAGNPGTFSSCDGTLTLRMQLGVAGVGWFGSLYTVTMVR